MGKNDFDIDFDFEEEYGFDPKAFLGTEDYDADIDLTEFTDEELGLRPAAEPADEEPSAQLGESSDSGFDMDEALNLDDFLNLGSEEETEEEAEDDYALTYSEEEENNEEPDLYEEDQPEEERYDAEPDYFGDADPEETDMSDTMEYSEEEEYLEEDVFEDEPVDDPEADTSVKRQRKARKPVKINLPKITTPKIFTKFYDLYFAPVVNKGIPEEPQDPNNPRRRRRKTKAQIFKEVYLPPILVCVTLILVLSFVIGSVSNVIAEKRLEAQQAQSEQEASIDAAAQAEQEYLRVMAQADELAANYNYEEAINLLESFGDATEYPDLGAKKAALITEMQQLSEHREPALIPNLSFHVLIEDLPRAMADDDDFAGSYNRNFVSTGEFKAILNQLYANGYVLVDFDSFTDVQKNVDGTEQYFPKAIYLPAGKKPIMLTETLVNYFGYMVDGNDDGVADAQGDGFASKLVVQNGTIKAEYVNANGETLIGDYDLVPILESFIAEHPDFSYQGARATLAVTGYEGVFGYRTNTSYIATKGQAYYDQECAGAKEVVDKLRELGYNIACFTYRNVAYGDMSAAQITADLSDWTQQITPVVGQVDTLVFARTSNIPDYTNTLFNVLYTSGFRFFVSNGTQPYAEVNSTYVRQNRLMVTGNSMAWNPSWFTGIFDAAAVLDVNTRGDVPN